MENEAKCVAGSGGATTKKFSDPDWGGISVHPAEKYMGTASGHPKAKSIFAQLLSNLVILVENGANPNHL